MRFRARMQKRQWVVKPFNKEAGGLSRTLKVSPLTANILINRRINDHKTGLAFLNPRLTELDNPEDMAGIEAAVERIAKAISKGEKICVYGDYDVDGITSITIMLRILKLLGADADFYIPHRIDEGYGLNHQAIDGIIESGVKLIITVDCGVTAIAEAQYLADKGIDLVITDHHRFGEKLPKACAIVHPALGDEKKRCAGAMVAFKLAWALANKFKNGDKVDEQTKQFLIDATIFAAMGTVADVIDLIGENRVVVSFGLSQIHRSAMPGIQALIDAAGLTGQKLDSYNISFGLAPMINAAGRMGHARLAVELLTSDSEMRCFHIAGYLKQQNNLRRKHEREIFKNACELIGAIGLDHPDRKSIVISSDDWHRGVIGIVASRVVERFYKPAILINTANGTGCGSGRSIAGFNILDAIDACSEHLITYGGHDMAAGVTVETNKINDFAQSLEEYAQANLTDSDSVAKLEIEGVCSIGDMAHSVVRELEMLSPFGAGNCKPVFASNGVRLMGRPRKVGAKGEHLQLVLGDGSGQIRAVGFKMASIEKKLQENEFFNIAYEPGINNYNGNSNVEFVLSDVQFE